MGLSGLTALLPGGREYTFLPQTLPYMGMAKKTFKIGEYCAGGIIQAVVNDKEVTVIQKQWDFSAGSTKSSDQSNAQEMDRETVNADDSNARRTLSDFMERITTHYYSEQVLEWIESKVELKKSGYFSW